MARVQQRCYVFIDNSNIIIEGQRFFARLKHLNVSVEKDTRFRVDVGRMLDVSLKGRDKLFVKLYGSVPSPNDTLWKEIRNQGVLVDYEEAVGASVTAEVTEAACALREPTGSVTFIIISGGRDYTSCYEKVLKYKWKLEIVTWEHCLTPRVRNFAQNNQNGGVGVILLNTLVDENPDGWFLDDKWQAQKRLPRDRTFAFEYERSVNEKEAKQINSDVTDLIKFPCRYLHAVETDAKIVIISIIPDQIGKYSTGILYERIKAKFATRCKRIVDFVTFLQEKNASQTQI